MAVSGRQAQAGPRRARDGRHWQLEPREAPVGVPMSPKRPFLQNVRNGQNRPFWLVKWTKMVIVTYLECPRSRGGCPGIGGQTRQNGRFY